MGNYDMKIEQKHVEVLKANTTQPSLGVHHFEQQYFKIAEEYKCTNK